MIFALSAGAEHFRLVEQRRLHRLGLPEMGGLGAEGDVMLAAMHGGAPSLHVGGDVFSVERRAKMPAQQGLEFAAVAQFGRNEDQSVGGAERLCRRKLVMASITLLQALGLAGIVDAEDAIGRLVRHEVDARQVEEARLVEINERELLAEDVDLPRHLISRISRA
ncbi:MAG: hypothetical protein IPO30_03045 [Hyphomonadaceae bacterium]|nr:hypothetical protein [Hyphomonadaceae bacterium]